MDFCLDSLYHLYSRSEVSVSLILISPKRSVNIFGSSFISSSERTSGRWLPYMLWRRRCSWTTNSARCDAINHFQSFQAIPLSGCAAIIFIHITSAVSTAFYSQVKLQANEHFLQDNLECKIPQLDLTFKWGRKVVLEAINLFTLTLLRIAPLHLFQIWT